MKKTHQFIKFLIPKGLEIFVRSYLFRREHSRKVPPKPWHKPGKFPTLNRVCLMLGHSNPLTTLGGTERIILQEMEQLILERRDFVFIYPRLLSKGFYHKTANDFGVIVNGHDLLVVNERELLSFIQLIQPIEIRVHHLRSWQLGLVQEVLKELRALSAKSSVYVHDFYFKCPQLNAACINGHQKCKLKFTQETLITWRKEYSEIFELADGILVPSDFVSEIIPTAHKNKITFYKGYQLRAQFNREKLAYLGAASSTKGYDTWLTLANNALITRAYELIHIGHTQNTPSTVKTIPYSFRESRDCLASRILQENNIKKVLLWSRVPETYSFTLHEAIEAKTFVITNLDSGNINRVISTNASIGVALESEYALIQYLLQNV